MDYITHIVQRQQLRDTKQHASDYTAPLLQRACYLCDACPDPVRPVRLAAICWVISLHRKIERLSYLYPLIKASLSLKALFNGCFFLTSSRVLLTAKGRITAYPLAPEVKGTMPQAHHTQGRNQDSSFSIIQSAPCRVTSLILDRPLVTAL